MGGRLTAAPIVSTARWRVVGATATGASHRLRDEPGQDAAGTAWRADGAAIVAVADGAGSAPLAAEGAAIAVEAAVAALTNGADIATAFGAAHDALGDDPDERSARATTLLVAVLGDDTLDVGQVGDGFVVTRSAGGTLDVVVAAPEREYLNETTFLSSTGWRDDLRVDSIDAADVDGVALLTDGLQLVAIELATNAPFAGFFAPLFAWAAGDEASDDALAEFLAAPRLAERTDDDITLVLAVREP